MAKPFLKNAWYAAAWSYEVKKELFERTIIGESILFYRKENNQAVAIKRWQHELLLDGIAVWGKNRWCPDGLEPTSLGPPVQ